MANQKHTYEFDLSKLAEPPIVEEGFELIIQIARGSGRVPKGWKETLEERGLSWKKKELPGGQLMLSVRTINFREFRELHDRFVHRMPWSHEITQWWHRAFTSIELSRHFEDEAIERAERERPEISTPAAMVRGITFEPEQLGQFRDVRAQSRLIAQQERAQARLASTQSSRALPEGSAFDSVLNEQNARWEEEQARAESSTRTPDPIQQLQERLRQRYQAQRHDADDVRPTPVSWGGEHEIDVYGDVLWLFQDRHDLTLGAIVETTRFSEDAIRPALDRLISEGKVRADEDGFHANESCWEDSGDDE